MIDLILNVLVIIVLLSLPGFVMYFKNSVYAMYSIEDFKKSAIKYFKKNSTK